MATRPTFQLPVSGSPLAPKAKKADLESAIQDGFDILHGEIEDLENAQFTEAPVYADQAAGLAATNDGDQFRVDESGSPNIAYSVFNNANGSAQFVASVPSPSALSEKADTSDLVSLQRDVAARRTDWIHGLDDGAGGRLLPTADLDLENDRHWLNGGLRAQSEALTDNGDGSFTLNELPEGIEGGVTVLVEWTDEGHSGTPSGAFWGMIGNPTSLAGEVAMLAGQTGVNGDMPQVEFRNRNTSTVSADKMGQWGCYRAAVAAPESGSGYRRVIENLDVVQDDEHAVTNWTDPTVFVIGADARNSRSVLTNLTLKRITVFAGALTAAQLDTLMDVSDPARSLRTTDYPDWLAVLDDGHGGQIVPWCQISQSRGRCWHDGRERPLSDVLRDNGDGTFTMIDIPKGLDTHQTGVTVATDYSWPSRYVYADRPDGTLASWVVTSGNTGRLEISVQQNVDDTVVSPGGVHNVQTFFGYAGEFWTGSVSYTGSSGLSRTEGVMRAAYAVPSSGNLRGFTDSSIPGESLHAVTGTFNSPIQLDFYRRAFDSGDPAANVTLDQLIIYDTDLSEDQLWELKLFNEYRMPPLFFYGDSLNNVAQPRAAFRLLTKDWGYLPSLSAGQGGRGMSYHKDYISAILMENPKIKEFVPVIIEGGLDYQSLNYPDGTVTEGPYSDRDIVQYYRDIFAMFDRPESVLVSPHKNAQGQSLYEASPTALSDAWLKMAAPGGDQEYQLFNPGDVPVAYKIATTAPPDDSGSKWIMPGAYSNVFAVAGSSGEAIYAKSAVAGASGEVMQTTGSFSLSRVLETLERLEATWPQFWCDWHGLMQAEAPDDATFDQLVEWHMTPEALRNDNVHINWIKDGTTNEPGGYHYMALGILARLLTLGYRRDGGV